MRNQCDNSNQKPVHAAPSRREALIAGAAMMAAPFLGGVTSTVQTALAANTGLPAGSPAQAQAGKVRGTGTEWFSYGSDKASLKYSPLAQIDKDNFNRLSVAWTWRSAEEAVANANDLKTWAWEATPLMVGGVLYVSTSLSQVAAIDAATGKTRWVYNRRRGRANAVQQRIRASRRFLLGGWERSTHPIWHRRRLSDLPERADGQAHLHLRPRRAH